MAGMSEFIPKMSQIDFSDSNKTFEQAAASIKGALDIGAKTANDYIDKKVENNTNEILDFANTAKTSDEWENEVFQQELNKRIADTDGWANREKIRKYREARPTTLMQKEKLDYEVDKQKSLKDDEPIMAQIYQRQLQGQPVDDLMAQLSNPSNMNTVLTNIRNAESENRQQGKYEDERKDKDYQKKLNIFEVKLKNVSTQKEQITPQIKDLTTELNDLRTYFATNGSKLPPKQQEAIKAEIISKTEQLTGLKTQFNSLSNTENSIRSEATSFMEGYNNLTGNNSETKNPDTGSYGFANTIKDAELGKESLYTITRTKNGEIYHNTDIPTDATVGQVKDITGNGHAGAGQFSGNYMQEAIANDYVKTTDKWTDNTTQSNLFAYGLFAKRKAIGNYIKGKSNNLDAAINAGSMEWAALFNSSGKGHYNDGINKATTSSRKMLQDMRKAYADIKKNNPNMTERDIEFALVSGDGTVGSNTPNTNPIQQEAQRVNSQRTGTQELSPKQNTIVRPDATDALLNALESNTKAPEVTNSEEIQIPFRNPSTAQEQVDAAQAILDDSSLSDVEKVKQIFQGKLGDIGIRNRDLVERKSEADRVPNTEVAVGLNRFINNSPIGAIDNIATAMLGDTTIGKSIANNLNVSKGHYNAGQQLVDERAAKENPEGIDKSSEEWAAKRILQQLKPNNKFIKYTDINGKEQTMANPLNAKAVEENKALIAEQKKQDEAERLAAAQEEAKKLSLNKTISDKVIARAKKDGVSIETAAKMYISEAATNNSMLKPKNALKDDDIYIGAKEKYLAAYKAYHASVQLINGKTIKDVGLKKQMEDAEKFYKETTAKQMTAVIAPLMEIMQRNIDLLDTPLESLHDLKIKNIDQLITAISKQEYPSLNPHFKDGNTDGTTQWFGADQDDLVEYLRKATSAMQGNISRDKEGNLKFTGGKLDNNLKTIFREAFQGINTNNTDIFKATRDEKLVAMANVLQGMPALNGDAILEYFVPRYLEQLNKISGIQITGKSSNKNTLNYLEKLYNKYSKDSISNAEVY